MRSEVGRRVERGRNIRCDGGNGQGPYYKFDNPYGTCTRLVSSVVGVVSSLDDRIPLPTFPFPRLDSLIYSTVLTPVNPLTPVTDVTYKDLKIIKLVTVPVSSHMAYLDGFFFCKNLNEKSKLTLYVDDN